MDKELMAIDAQLSKQTKEIHKTIQSIDAVTIKLINFITPNMYADYPKSTGKGIVNSK